MLVISTILASMVASSSAWVSYGCSGTIAGEGSGLFLPPMFPSCNLVVGGGLILLSAIAPTVSQVSTSHWSTGSKEGISYDNIRFNYHSILLIGKYSTTPFVVPTSWLVVSVIFNFLAERFHTTLCGLLDGGGIIALRLAGFSTVTGMLGKPGRLNLDRS
jgi:hypothetical protein